MNGMKWSQLNKNNNPSDHIFSVVSWMILFKDVKTQQFLSKYVYKLSDLVSCSQIDYIQREDPMAKAID